MRVCSLKCDKIRSQVVSVAVGVAPTRRLRLEPSPFLRPFSSLDLRDAVASSSTPACADNFSRSFSVCQD